jgi:hypothetical protein
VSGEFTDNIRKDLTKLVNEAFVHLVMFAFLQRVLNGGADFMQRDCALNNKRCDIVVEYKGLSIRCKFKSRATSF